MSSSSKVFRSLADLFIGQYAAYNELKPTDPKQKVVVIVGAGASKWSAMPSWSDPKLIKRIFEIARDCFSGPSYFIDELWQKLAVHVGLERSDWKALAPGERERRFLELFGVTPDEVETVENDDGIPSLRLDHICGVACENAAIRKRVLDELSIIYRHPALPEPEESLPTSDVENEPPPQLAYEILAHLVKHEFVNHIITFNFDDIMTTAIENELGPDAFDLFISDQQLPPRTDERRPRVIQLHGSIRAAESLRFRHTDTHVLSNEFVRLLDDSLFGPVDRVAPNVHLVSLGYSWGDRDFADWIIARAHHIESITVVQLEDSVPPNLQSRYLRGIGHSTESDLQRKIHILSTRAIAASGDKPISIDQLLWALWKRIVEALERKGEDFLPASRHILLGQIFGPKDQRTLPEAQPDQFNVARITVKKRFLAEALLHIVKCRGMVNASVMARDRRIQKYHSALGRKQEPDPLGWMIEQKHWKESSAADVKEAYYSTDDSIDNLVDRFKNSLFDDAPERIPEPRFVNHRIRLHDTWLEDFLRTHIERAFSAPEVEIVPGMDPSADWFFRKPEPITTYRKLQGRTGEVLKASDWTHLLLIAESGLWLTDKSVKRVLDAKAHGGTILLLEPALTDADRADWRLLKPIRRKVAEEHKKLADRYHIVRGELSWWEHNRHLRLPFGPGWDSKRRCHSGIYFRRRHKASQVAPFYLSHELDCAELLVTFLAYVRRSCEEGKLFDRPDWRRFGREAWAVGDRARDWVRRVSKNHSKSTVSARLDQILSAIEALAGKVIGTTLVEAKIVTKTRISKALKQQERDVPRRRLGEFLVALGVDRAKLENCLRNS